MTNYLETDISIDEMKKILSGLKNKAQKELIKAKGKPEMGKCEKCSLVWIDRTPNQPTREKKRYDLFVFQKDNLLHQEKMTKLLKETIKKNKSVADIYKKENYLMKMTTKSVSRKRMISFFNEHYPDVEIKTIETKMVKSPKLRVSGNDRLMNSRLPKKKYYFIETADSKGNTIKIEGNGHKNDVLKKFF